MLRSKVQETAHPARENETSAVGGIGNAQQAMLASSVTPAPAESKLLQAAITAEEGGATGDVETGTGITTGTPDGAPADTPAPLSATDRATAMLAEFDEEATLAEAAGTDYAPTIQQGQQAAELIYEATAGMTAEERATWFAGEGQGLLTHVQDSMTGAGRTDDEQASYQATVSALMRAGEESGEDISGVIAETLRSTGDELRLGNALVEGIESGDGGLVAAQAALDAVNGGYFHHSIVRAFQSTSGAYQGARRDRMTTEAEWAPQLAADEHAADHPELFDPEVRQTSREQALERLVARREAEETAAGVYASTLDGQALLARQPSPVGVTLGHFVGGGGIEHLSETEAGRQAAAASLLRAGQGDNAWITQATEGGPMTEGVRDLITSGTLEGVGLLKAAGSGSEASSVVLGAAEALGDHDPAMADAMRIAAPSLEGVRDPAEYSAIMTAAATQAGITIPDAAALAEMRERGEALDPQAAFLQQLGVFAGAGEEFARDNDVLGTTVGTAETATSTAMNLLDATRRQGPAGLGGMRGSLRIAGGIDAIVGGSDSMRDWVNLSLGGGDIASEILGVMGRNTERFNTGLMRSNALAGGVFATVDLASALRDGRDQDAAAAAGQLLTNGAALGMTAHAAKRFLGVVGVAWTAYDVYSYFDAIGDNNARSREMLSASALAALGVSPEAADDFAEFAGGRDDGSALARFQVMSEGMDMSTTELAAASLPDDPIQRQFLLNAITNAPPTMDGDDAQNRLDLQMRRFAAMQAIPRLPGEHQSIYIDRLNRASQDAEMQFLLDGGTY